MTELSILLVDDDDRLRERLGKALSARNHLVLLAAGYEEALQHAKMQPIDRAVIDLRMPGQGGLELVRELLALRPETEIVVLTGYGSIATAVEAMRLGARDYLTKPCHADRILAAFDAEAEPPSAPPTYEIPSLARLEREHIERVLRECNGNVSKTARLLGIHRRTLQYKLAKFPVTR
jgi:two-component system response regulator RegA